MDLAYTLAAIVHRANRFAVEVPTIAAGAAPATGRGGARGGRGPGGGALTPEGSLAAALKAAPTTGVFWTSEAVGYAVKYARRIEQPGGAERIILVTDRRVGASNNSWNPAPPIPPSDAPFSIIEIRVNAAGKGEGKGVVTGKVVVDKDFQTLALEGYDALPAILRIERSR